MISKNLFGMIKTNDIVKQLQENNSKTSSDLLKELEKIDEKIPEKSIEKTLEKSDEKTPEKNDEKVKEKSFKEKLLLLVNDELSKKFKNKLNDFNKECLIKLINNKESELFLKNIEEFKLIDNKLNLSNLSSLIENLYKILYNMKIKDTINSVNILKFLIEYVVNDNPNKDDILSSLDELSNIFVNLLILRKNLKKNKPSLLSCFK
jgi:hypothetical protein